ncbi:MAG: sigma-70 family RNA polymerase sigma factor [Phycisphaerae bacterium]|nr:sigma-70 family RNA polymerase sigma factor [Phycisphaerae bacterium]
MDKAESGDMQSLIERARQGDEAALGELLTVHTERLLASIRAELGNRLRQRLESQDVMQQVYLDALRNIDQFEDHGSDSFFRWLRRIAVNRICDVDRKAFKAAKRCGELRAGDVGKTDASVLDLLDHLPGSVSGPVTKADRSDRLQMLQAALDQLSEDHREVLRLRYLRQLSFEETAAEMDRSGRAIRSLCVRAVLRLRELLSGIV